MKKHLFLLSALLIQVAAVSVFAQDKEYVDLGLSVKWATCNEGAATPLEVGENYDWNYKLQQGEDWHTPSNDEMIELLSYCTWTWVENVDSCGFKVTSDIEGFTDRSIFIPVLKERIPIHEIVRTSDVGYSIVVVDSSYNHVGYYMTNYINDYNRPGSLDGGGYYPMPTLHKNGYPLVDNYYIRPVKSLDPLTKQNRVLPHVELRESYPVRNDSVNIDISDFEGLEMTTEDAPFHHCDDLDLVPIQ